MNRRGVGYRLVDGTPASICVAQPNGDAHGADGAAVALRRLEAAA